MNSSVVKPRRCVRLPNTAVRPSMKIVGASTPGIAAPGTRASSFIARRISTRAAASCEPSVICPVVASYTGAA